MSKAKYYIGAVLVCLVAACQSPAKKQHQDKLEKANSLQNPNDEATTDPDHRINSGNLTDSTERTDTGSRK
jgi:uncharacterized lipoprotein